MNIRRNEKADLARKKGGDERIRVGRDREERARAAKTHEEREERWMMDAFRARTHRRTQRGERARCERGNQEKVIPRATETGIAKHRGRFREEARV